MTDLKTERITRAPGVCGGKACIAGHRVRVMDIMILHELMGKTGDEIVSEFPSLTLSDVYAALTYYFDHVDEIREDMRSEDEVGENFRAKYPSKLKQKLEGAAD
jgi:uncharacterized protein (DUF433 family)